MYFTKLTEFFSAPDKTYHLILLGVRIKYLSTSQVLLFNTLPIL